MNELMSSLLGANWRTTLVGYVKLIICAFGQYLMSGQPIPTDWKGWAILAYGAVGVVQGHVTKDANVSNAPQPMATAQTVNK